MLHITKKELEILNVLWAADRPLSRAEILELSVNKSWSDNSIHILLNGLLKNGAIEEAGFARSGKVRGRLYAPTLTLEEYYAKLFLAGASPDPVKLIRILLARGVICKDNIKELQAVLNHAQEMMEEDS